MLMFTDGLATFSVFIEPATDTIPEGVAQRGATLAMMTGLEFQEQLYRVTIVGEIPVITAQRIAQGITHR
jgi:sigma-E factor negative regulatory protein RseB